MSDKKNKINNSYFKASGGNYKEVDFAEGNAIHRSLSATQDTKASRIKLKAGFNRHDYEKHRTSSILPREHKDILMAVQGLYKKDGLVRNIIDLMADFASEDLKLEHPIKKHERFYRNWAKRVNLKDRVHDFIKLLARDANVIVRRKMAIIDVPLSKQMSQSKILKNQSVQEGLVAEDPERMSTDKQSESSRSIPIKYVFISPIITVKTAGAVGSFFGDDSIGIEIPAQLSTSINNPTTNVEKEFVKKIPQEIRDAVSKRGSRIVAMDMRRIYVDYYKKDDWDEWGTPFLYGVLEDILFKEKMRLADIAALDGVINVVRLWKLGSVDKEIFPSRTTIDKLSDILQHNTGGGMTDIIWDDLIDYKVDYPPTDKILGDAKYQSVNSDIVRGLGIPDSLIGGQDLGTRNAESAFVQLKTLVERLEYLRSKAVRWIETELKIVADAMGFKDLPFISFGTMSLKDEVSEKELLIKLLDRNIISVDSIQKVFGFDFMVELNKLKDEQQLRDTVKPVLEKSSPFYRPESIMKLQNELDKSKLGGGENFSGDLPRKEENIGPGRPDNITEIGPREEKTTPILSIYQVKGDSLIDELNQLIDPIYLKDKGIKNIRSLTKDQKKELSNTKFFMLASLVYEDKISLKTIKERLSSDRGAIKRQQILKNINNDIMQKFINLNNRGPNTRESNLLLAISWSLMNIEGT